MNNTKLAMAVAGGYVLGRLGKARWALAVAGLMAGKKLSTNPKALLGGALEASAPLRGLADSVRGPLVKAGTKAAVAAAGHQMENLTDRLEQRTESLRDATAGHGDEPEEERDDQREDEREDDESSRTSKSRTSKSRSRSGTTSDKGSRSRSESSTRSSSRSKPSTPAKSSTPKKSDSQSGPKQTARRRSTASGSGSRASTGKSAGKSTGKE